MKICMPTETNLGLKSIPYNHFGTAPLFVVYNTDDASLNVIHNGDLGHEHGMCQPLKALGGHSIDVLLVGGIGQGALNKLTEMGITSYHASPLIFEENIKLLDTNKLSPFDTAHVCSSHDCTHTN